MQFWRTSWGTDGAVRLHRVTRRHGSADSRRSPPLLPPAAGVEAGLGRPPLPDGATLEPAWAAVPATAARLPVYDSWEFATGPDGDFESLARRLHASPVDPGAAEPPMLDLTEPGGGMPRFPRAAAGAVLGLQSALRAPGPDAPPPWPDATRVPFQPPSSACSGSARRRASPQGVLLLRDEIANLAWAVERTVEGEDGRPADRAQAGYEGAAPAPAPPGPAGPAGPLPYRLRTDPPQHWFPLLPQRDQPTDPSMSFRLAALARAAPGPPLHPLGRLLAPMVANPNLMLHEEEVPREGARVTRAYQLARWMDGSTHLWLGRRTGVGRGEGSSGLRFDSTDPPPVS